MSEEKQEEKKEEKPAEAKEEAEEPKEEKEEKEEKKKKKKSRKDRVISEKKHTKVQIWKKYEISEGKVIRKGKSCPRCGVGTFLAEAENRVYCGRCGYAEIKKAS